MKNIKVFILNIFSFLEVKFSIYLNRRVFVMLYGHLNVSLGIMHVCDNFRKYVIHMRYLSQICNTYAICTKQYQSAHLYSLLLHTYHLCNVDSTSRKHAYIILTPLNLTFM